MPFSRSRSIESMTRSLTDALLRLVGRERAGLPEHRVDERGLAVVDVGDDRDVAQVVSGCCRHGESARSVAGGDPGSLRARAGAARTRRPCPRPSAGRPSAPRASRPAAGRARPRRRPWTLRSRGSGWSASLTPRVTIVVEEQRRQLDRAAGVPQRVGDQLADQQLGELDHRLELPRCRACSRTQRAGGGDRLDAAVELPGPRPGPASRPVSWATSSATSSSCPAVAAQRRRGRGRRAGRAGRPVGERRGRGGAARRRCRRRGTRPARRCRAPAAHPSGDLER